MSRANAMRSATAAVLLVGSLLTACASDAPASVLEQRTRFDAAVELPDATTGDETTLAAALANRRSGREFSTEPLDLETIGALLWAAQGITDDGRGYRTAPSAGARFPLEVYAVTAAEVLHYLPSGHRVEKREDAGTIDRLGEAAFGQTFLADAPVVIVISAVVSRTEAEYGAVADDLVNRESGHAAQNVLLQATALDLAAVPIGGFDPAEVAELLAFTSAEEPLYLIPVGHRP